MRKALDKLKDLYSSSQGQDVLETLVNTGVITGTQALAGDMTPEELAMSAALGLGGGFAGRHYGGRVGTVAGRQLDKHFPEAMSDGKEFLNKFYDQIGEEGLGIRPGARMKFEASMDGRSPGEGIGNLVGRTYGDNVLQALIGLGTYGYFNDEA